MAQPDRGGKGHCQPRAWKPVRQHLPPGQAALTSDGLDRLNVQRDEPMSLGSYRKTRGPEEAVRGWDGAGSGLTKPSPTGDNGIAWTRPEPVLRETQGPRIHHSLGTTLIPELPCCHGLCPREASQVRHRPGPRPLPPSTLPAGN